MCSCCRSGGFCYGTDKVGLYEQLELIIQSQSEWSDSALSIGAPLELASLEELGMKRVWRLIARIPGQNFGTVIKWKRMLSLMNFGEVGFIYLYIDTHLGIDISHMLRWLDRYPVRVEIKGASRPLLAKKIWITSNLDPRLWYPDCDEQTKDALMRRLEVVEFGVPEIVLPILDIML